MSDPNQPYSLFDSFPEPRTMPVNWDLSELMSLSGLPNAGHARTPENADSSLDLADEEQEGGESLPGFPNQFPDHRIYPTRWDLSA